LQPGTQRHVGSGSDSAPTDRVIRLLRAAGLPLAADAGQAGAVVIRTCCRHHGGDHPVQGRAACEAFGQCRRSQGRAYFLPVPSMTADCPLVLRRRDPIQSRNRQRYAAPGLPGRPHVFVASIKNATRRSRRRDVRPMRFSVSGRPYSVTVRRCWLGHESETVRPADKNQSVKGHPARLLDVF
jgi:hypothetical protein